MQAPLIGLPAHTGLKINKICCVKLSIVNYLSVMDAQKNCLNETVLLSTHNISLIEK